MQKETIEKLFTVSEKDVIKFNEDVARYMCIRDAFENEKKELDISIKKIIDEEIMNVFENNELHARIYSEERLQFFKSTCMYCQERLNEFSDEIRDFCESQIASQENLTSKLH